ncbi:hypothetical protein [Microbulbifer elongatus]|uniref:hypothetical protein n=1 Tax=Microbulbifer elongatus TaxID=86173 RepID=UPI001E5CE0E1|nr:hypothetical protein [Microbulbifer elongatus]
MNILLHIGTEKTGTTSIQEFLFKNRSVLGGNGYYFLQSPGQKNNRALPSICMRADKTDDFFIEKGVVSADERKSYEEEFLKKFKEEIETIPNNVHTVVCSSEHFHSRLTYEDEVKKLKNILDGYFDSVQILVYLRPQADVALSLYSTTLRSGNDAEFSDVVERQCVPSNEYYDYKSLLERWNKIFGDGSVTPKVFRKDWFYQGNLLRDFAFSINEALVERCDFDVPKKNESINHFGQVLIKLINRHLPRFLPNKGINKLNLSLGRLVASECPGKGLSLGAEEYSALQARFDELNLCLSKEYFSQESNVFECALPSDENRMLSEEHVELLDSVLGMVVNSKSAGLASPFVDDLRDAAILLEEVDVEKSYRLMKLAAMFRPRGPKIREKLRSYEKLLKEASKA